MTGYEGMKMDEVFQLSVSLCSRNFVQAILLKIGAEADIERFNGRLQQLLLGSKGLLAGWLDGQKLLQEVGAIAARARTRCQQLNQLPPDRQCHGSGDNGSGDFAV